MTECPNCSIEIPRVNLKIHIKDVCPKATIPCPGSILGCIHVSERVVVVEHAKTCPMATIAPHFQSQKARLDEFEKQNKVLERKVEVLEGGFANINNMLWPSNPSDGSSFPVSDPLDPNAVDTSTPAQLPGTPDFRLPPPSFPPPQQTEQAPTSGYPPPFDSSTHHLLSLHESLREEVTRIANALTEVEGRTTMMIINENQRAKEEMLHTNAAINAMRMQLHWLTSARLQQSQNRPTSSAGSSAAGRSGGSNNGSGNGNGGSGSGASSLGTPHPLRRMSDLNRQDTKL
ncbi:hypothetical protein K432DRAFT_214816 [Lepidopterella palustris CBS 459.81]|uniref:TRAF-type domain-containing protein n=1 Tax=Lepidopterella palustris CBS 459.81 TaxID=1314670 RepID=A0A8E2JHG2_9PEZI|nr:hypothetical protein K432DRAFT_214816 [Lepidopterella palustris CBS 459.81]